MDSEKAVLVLIRHVRECAMMMPLKWLKENGDGSEFMQAMQLAIDALKERGETHV